MDPGEDLSTRVDVLMDGLVADLERLTAIPPIAFPGFPPEPVREAHDLLVDLLRGAGVERVERLDLLVTRLESPRPFRIPLTVTPGDQASGCEPATDGPAYRAARTALRDGMGDLRAPNERVLFSELRSAVIAEGAFLREYARTYGTATGGDTA
ncbi:hypothetical protein [Streptomyces sp. NPDC058542]|uniref:hypothetical protein n=1 Tax=Streptomyces sp. NPDC058542 TaxID=3346543 RepID=UPI003657C5A4